MCRLLALLLLPILLAGCSADSRPPPDKVSEKPPGKVPDKAPAAADSGHGLGGMLNGIGDSISRRCENPSAAEAKSHSSMRRMLSSVLVGIAQVGCSRADGLPELPLAPGHEYRLGSGDIVRVITYGEDPLTGEFRVSDQGSIALPLAGAVKALGRTPGELEEAIAAALKKRDMLRKPSVSVEVATYRPIYVLGEVNKPGQYPYQPGMTVISAAAVAGGFTYRAVEDYVSVVRTVDGESLESRAVRQAQIQPGDVITVFERRY